VKEPIIRSIIAFGSLIFYAVVFLAVYPYVHLTGAALNIVPAAVFGWLLGMRGGLAYGLLAAPINVFLFRLAGNLETGAIIPHLIGTAIFTLAGTGIGWIKDLSERVERQSAALQQEQKLLLEGIKKREQLEGHLIEAQRIARLGNWVRDLSGNLTSASAEFYRTFGITDKEFDGTLESLLQHVSPDDRNMVRSAFSTLFNDYQPCSIQYRIIHSDGTESVVHEKGEIGCNDSGEIMHAVGTVQDITEQKAGETERLSMERQLMQSQKLESLGAIAGGIAHNFNNLLGVVIGNLELSLLKLSPDSATHKNLQQAMSASQRAANLTRQILDYAGAAPLDMKETDINSIVGGNLDLLRSSVSRHVSLFVAMAPDLPPVLADEGQIRQVIMHLLINASEAIGLDSGSITLSTGSQECDEELLRRSRLSEKPPAGRFVYVEVSDNGCGMDEKTQRRLFDPFYTTKFLGRGLGMSSVLGIVRSHKGAILLDSEAGRASVFRILLPVSYCSAQILGQSSSICR